MKLKILSERHWMSLKGLKNIVGQVSRCRWQQSESESNKTFVLEKSHKNICPMTLTFFESLTGYFMTKKVVSGQCNPVKKKVIWRLMKGLEKRWRVEVDPQRTLNFTARHLSRVFNLVEMKSRTWKSARRTLTAIINLDFTICLWQN